MTFDGKKLYTIQYRSGKWRWSYFEAAHGWLTDEKEHTTAEEAEGAAKAFIEAIN